MAKADPLGVRLELDEREAFEAAAEADGRAQSALARKIISDWLKKHGWLKPKRKEARGDE